MARFYASTSNERNKVRTHGGRSELNAHVRGWNCGLRVVASVRNGMDTFEIYKTDGSNGDPSGEKLIKVVIDKKSAGSRDVKGRLK